MCDETGLTDYPSEQNFDPWLEHGVDQEMKLVECLSRWKPFDEPTQELVEIFTDLCEKGQQNNSDVARARQIALAELAKQDDAFAVP